MNLRLKPILVLFLWFGTMVQLQLSAAEESLLCEYDGILSTGWWHVTSKPEVAAVIGVGYEAGESPEDAIPYVRTSMALSTSDGTVTVFSIKTNLIVVAVTNGVPVGLDVTCMVRSVRGVHSVGVFVIQPDPYAKPGELPAIFVPQEGNVEVPPDGTWGVLTTGRLDLCSFTNYFRGDPFKIDQSPRAHPLIFGIVHTSQAGDTGLTEFDFAEVEVCLVSEPPVFVLFRRHGLDTVSLSWRSVPDRAYTIEKSRNIVSGEWDFVTRLVAESTVTSFETKLRTEQMEFFRVRYYIEHCQ